MPGKKREEAGNDKETTGGGNNNKMTNLAITSGSSKKKSTPLKRPVSAIIGDRHVTPPNRSGRGGDSSLLSSSFQKKSRTKSMTEADGGSAGVKSGEAAGTVVKSTFESMSRDCGQSSSSHAPHTQKHAVSSAASASHHG